MKKVAILLSGSLAQKFGRRHERWLDTSTIKESMSALKNTIDGFTEAILELEGKGTQFAVFKNRKNIGVEDLSTSGLEEVRIVPVIAGSKSGGVFGVIAGVILIGLSFIPALAFASTALLIGGAAMAIGGALSMLSPQPKQPKLGDEEGNAASYGFGGAVSTTASGNNVPLLYGERLIGGAYASASVINYDIRV